MAHDEILLEAPEDKATGCTDSSASDGAGWTAIFKEGASESGGSDRQQLGREVMSIMI